MGTGRRDSTRRVSARATAAIVLIGVGCATPGDVESGHRPDDSIHVQVLGRQQTRPAPTLEAPPARPVPFATVSVVPTVTEPSVAPLPVPSPSMSTEDAVLARIAFPWRDVLAGWTIEFTGNRRGLRGATFPPQRLIQIYVDPGSSIESLAHVTTHEIGHALDVTFLTDADREAFSAARGRSAGSPWWVADGASDFSSGAGDWAECFAFAQDPGGGFYSHLGGGAPDDEQLTLMVALLG